MKALTASLKRVWQDYRAVVGKFAFELVVVFVGVTAAFALENARQDAEEAAYRREVIAAVGPIFASVGSHGRDISATIRAELERFDEAVARGEQPRLPVYREAGGEGPPTQIWDGLMATGAVRVLEPQTVWRLAALFNTLNSIGDRYRRYNTITETRVWALRPDHSDAWENGELRSEFRAYVQQHRELEIANDQACDSAEALQRDLARDYPQH